jgi:hypothetical protein
MNACAASGLPAVSPIGPMDFRDFAGRVGRYARNDQHLLDNASGGSRL